jgi:hypothetical protein
VSVCANQVCNKGRKNGNFIVPKRFPEFACDIDCRPLGTIRAHSPRCHDPSASTANINAFRQKTPSVSERFTIRLTKNVMLATTCCQRDRVFRDWTMLSRKNFECCHSIGPAVTISVNDHESGAAKFDTRDRIRIFIPPPPYRRSVRYRLRLPFRDPRLFVPATSMIVKC